jgi:hypothetical protein
MNKIFKSPSPTLILILALATANAAASQTTAQKPLEWQDFNSGDGGFTIKFPGAPKIDTPELKMGPVVVKRHSYSLRVGEFNFEVSVIDLPAGSDPAGAMEGGVRAVINEGTTRGATLINTDAVNKGNCNGREVLLSTPQAGGSRRGFLDTLIFSSGLRFFNIVFEAFSDTPKIREVGRTFVDSFGVNGGCSSMIAPSDAPAYNKTEEIVEGVPDQATGWRVIENNELGVRVLMPAAARHIINKTQSDPFPIFHHTYIYSNDGSVYSAEVFGDYPPGWHTTPARYQTSLDLTFYAIKKSFTAGGFEITPVRDLRLATNPGREYSLINAQRGSHGRAQIYVTATHIYIFSAFTRSDNPLTQISQFFSSVRISPK